MKLQVKNERENSLKKIVFAGTTVQELLKQLKINPETVIVVRNNEVITEDEELKDKEQIELLSVISGG
ncbi:sulfur carrier protein ThiS [Candidatus Woesearchaeota archaeon]|nr:sulfur carrier protein ThiS [Candidatus Woesearchaeota archaeon]